MLNHAIALKNVSISFGDHAILENANTSFGVGLTSVCGPSGIGKTTLLRAIIGEIPHKGKINFPNGFVKEQVIFIPTNGGNIDSLTVQDNLFLMDRNKDRVKTVLERLRLFEKRNRLTSKLSLGEQQRLAMGRAFLSEAPILLFDEPTANLDRASSERAFQILSELGKQRIVVVATHDVDLAQKYSLSVVQCNSGKLEPSKSQEGPILANQAPSKPRNSVLPLYKLGAKKAFSKPLIGFIGSLLTIAGTFFASNALSTGAIAKTDLIKSALSTFDKPYLQILDCSTIFSENPKDQLAPYDGHVLPIIPLAASKESKASMDHFFILEDEAPAHLDFRRSPSANITKPTFENGILRKGALDIPISLSERALSLLSSQSQTKYGVGDVLKTHTLESSNGLYQVNLRIFSTFEAGDQKADKLDDCFPFILGNDNYSSYFKTCGKQALTSVEFDRLITSFTEYTIKNNQEQYCFPPSFYGDISMDSIMALSDMPFHSDSAIENLDQPKIIIKGRIPSKANELLVPHENFYRFFGENSETVFPELSKMKEDCRDFFASCQDGYLYQGDGRGGLLPQVHSSLRLSRYKISGYYEVLSPALRSQNGEIILEDGAPKRTKVAPSSLPLIVSDKFHRQLTDWVLAKKGYGGNHLVIEEDYALSHPELLAKNFNIEGCYVAVDAMWSEFAERRKIYPIFGWSFLGTSMLSILLHLFFSEKDLAKAFEKTNYWGRKLSVFPSFLALTGCLVAIPAFLGTLSGYLYWIFVSGKPSFASLVLTPSNSPLWFIVTFLFMNLLAFGSCYAIYYFFTRMKGHRNENRN